MKLGLRRESAAGTARAATLVWSVWLRLRFDSRLKIVRYAAFGCAVSAGYTLNVVAFVELLGWRDAVLASVVSFIIWTPISYLGHRDFTFLFEGGSVSSGVRFTLAFLARLLAAGYTVYAATIFGLPYLIGVMANWVVLPLLSYFILDLWVFRPATAPINHDRHSEPARLPGA